MKALLLLPLLTVASLTHAQSTPQRSLEAFVAAFNRKDLPAAAKFVYGANPKANFSPFMQQAGKQPWPILHVSGVKTNLQRGSAVLTYTVRVEVPKGPPPQNETMNARLQAGRWMLVPIEAKTARSPFIPAIAHMLLDRRVLTGMMSASPSNLALSNIKQLALGALLLATDSNETFALSDADAKNKLRPYLRNPTIWTAPGDPKGTQSFHFNGAVGGKPMSGIPIPARTVLFYDGKNGVLRFRWRGRAAVAFADGHARLVTPEEAKALRWKP